MTVQLTEIDSNVEVTTYNVYTTYSFTSQCQMYAESEEVRNEDNA